MAFWLFLSPFDWNDFVAFDLWTQRRRGDVSQTFLVFVDFFVVFPACLGMTESKEMKRSARENFQFVLQIAFNFCIWKQKKKYFAISWMLVIAPLAREKETSEIC